MLDALENTSLPTPPSKQKQLRIFFLNHISDYFPIGVEMIRCPPKPPLIIELWPGLGCPSRLQLAVTIKPCYCLRTMSNSDVSLLCLGLQTTGVLSPRSLSFTWDSGCSSFEHIQDNSQRWQEKDLARTETLNDHIEQAAPTPDV